MKKKVGRPVTGNAADIRLHLRITKEQKEFWEAKAAKQGLPLSTWAKETLDKAK
jgi:predicted HicB family RNase H-like nuclease